MKALYIGILTDGTTSKMRADTLQYLTNSAKWQLIDTDREFLKANRLWRTSAFRFKIGPIITSINNEILRKTSDKQYDLIWVDKGIYIQKSTVEHLRKSTARMVHFTPDTAFYANRSRHFFNAARHYDLLATTKSFDFEKYKEIVDPKRVYLTTQAYDAGLHKPPAIVHEERLAAVFIGLCEPDREECIEELLRADVTVRVGGQGWEKFVKRHSGNQKLRYLGQKIFGEEYVSEYASAAVGLGLLSKRFPELHTTRTFEIPACGTLLATEKTADTEQFFAKDEVLFFKNYKQLGSSLKSLLGNANRISELSQKGHRRVMAGGYDYASVLSGILRRLSLSS